MVIAAFQLWCQQYHALTRDMDALLTAYLNELFALGYHMSATEYGFAAVRFRFPEYGRNGPFHLRRSIQALEGYRHLMPPQMRLPTPRTVFLAIVGWMFTRKLVLVGFAILLQWDLLLRPGDRVDHCAAFLLGVVATVKMQTPAENRIFPFNGTQLSEQFKAGARAMSLQILECTWYGNRHGGASELRLPGVSLMEIKRRGRWVRKPQEVRESYHTPTTGEQSPIFDPPVWTVRGSSTCEQWQPSSCGHSQPKRTDPGSSCKSFLSTSERAVRDAKRESMQHPHHVFLDVCHDMSGVGRAFRNRGMGLFRSLLPRILLMLSVAPLSAAFFEVGLATKPSLACLSRCSIMKSRILGTTGARPFSFWSDLASTIKCLAACGSSTVITLNSIPN